MSFPHGFEPTLYILQKHYVSMLVPACLQIVFFHLCIKFPECIHQWITKKVYRKTYKDINKVWWYWNQNRIIGFGKCWDNVLVLVLLSPAIYFRPSRYRPKTQFVICHGQMTWNLKDAYDCKISGEQVQKSRPKTASMKHFDLGFYSAHALQNILVTCCKRSIAI